MIRIILIASLIPIITGIVIRMICYKPIASLNGKQALLSTKNALKKLHPYQIKTSIKHGYQIDGGNLIP